MAKRTSKTAAQQCRYYEVDNIFEYMVETYINGNHSTFSELYHELNKEARQDFWSSFSTRSIRSTTERLSSKCYNPNKLTAI